MAHLGAATCRPSAGMMARDRRKKVVWKTIAGGWDRVEPFMNGFPILLGFYHPHPTSLRPQRRPPWRGSAKTNGMIAAQSDYR